jgi:hypothetical protein
VWPCEVQHYCHMHGEVVSQRCVALQLCVADVEQKCLSWAFMSHDIRTRLWFLHLVDEPMVKWCRSVGMRWVWLPLVSSAAGEPCTHSCAVVSGATIASRAAVGGMSHIIVVMRAVLHIYVWCPARLVSALLGCVVH